MKLENFQYFTKVFFPELNKLGTLVEMDCITQTVLISKLAVRSLFFIVHRISHSRNQSLTIPKRVEPSSHVTFPSIQRSTLFILFRSTRQRIITMFSSSNKRSINETTSEKGCKKLKISETDSQKLKIEVSKLFPDNLQENASSHQKQRPNYFVAVQILNSKINEKILEIQDHIISKDERYKACLSSIHTLHLTLMVMQISDDETLTKARTALENLYSEFNEKLVEHPLILEFDGLGHFGNKVLFVKLKRNEGFKQLGALAESANRHFTGSGIPSTDKRPFSPHLTIAKIDFSRKKQRQLKKINASLYEPYVDEYIGSHTINGIQLLKMTGPKTADGYYAGYQYLFG